MYNFGFISNYNRMKREIITTADGSKTIYLPEMNEQYHSVNGALTESEFVFIGNGYLYHKEQNPVIIEIGFGTGLNCLLTALQAEKQKRKTIYYTIDNYPLDKSVINKLEYDKKINHPNAHKLFRRIHECKWENKQIISSYFQLCKIKMDLTTADLKNMIPCNITYFDAFGPDKQPEMWTPEIFGKIFDNTRPGGIFVTYSAKGEVRRQLQNTGYTIERLPGPPGKNEMLRGIKINSVV